MAKEILEKIPVETKWAFTANVWSGGVAGLIERLGAFVGDETLEEILTKLWGAGGEQFYPLVKDTFNIPVVDAISAVNLANTAGRVGLGPEYEFETVVETPKRAVRRVTKCPIRERYKEYDVRPMWSICAVPCRAFAERGIKAVNPNIDFKLTKAPEWGDPYCEFVYELK